MIDETEVDHFDWLPSALAALGRSEPVPEVERTTLPSENGGLSGLQWGGPDPVAVLLHGAGQNAHTWDVVAALAGVPVLALDLPGHGHSPWRPDRDYRPETNARTIAASLDAAGVRPRAIVGMSLGGLTTIALLGSRPDLVQRALIVDILPRVGPTAARAVDPQVALIDGPREFASIAEMLDLTSRAVPGRPVAELRRGVVHNAIRTDDGRYRWRYDELDSARRIPHEALWEAVRGSTAPIALVRGGASAFVPPEAVDRLHRLRPDALVDTVDGAPHAVQSVAPARIAWSLAALLREELRVPAALGRAAGGASARKRDGKRDDGTRRTT